MKKNILPFFGVLLMSSCISAPSEYGDRAMRVGDYAVEVCMVIVVILLLVLLIMQRVNLHSIDKSLDIILRMQTGNKNVEYNEQGAITQVNGFKCGDTVKGPKGLAEICGFKSTSLVHLYYKDTRNTRICNISDIEAIPNKSAEPINGYSVGDIVKIKWGLAEITFLKENEVTVERENRSYTMKYSEIEKI